MTMDNVSIMCCNLCYVASEHESYLKYIYFWYKLLLLMVINMYKHMGKVMIKILQGSTVTQTVLGELTIHLPVANFLQCTCAKIMEIGWQQTKLLQKLAGLLFLAHPVFIISKLVWSANPTVSKH